MNPTVLKPRYNYKKEKQSEQNIIKEHEHSQKTPYYSKLYNKLKKYQTIEKTLVSFQLIKKKLPG